MSFTRQGDVADACGHGVDPLFFGVRILITLAECCPSAPGPKNTNTSVWIQIKIGMDVDQEGVGGDLETIGSQNIWSFFHSTTEAERATE